MTPFDTLTVLWTATVVLLALIPLYKHATQPSW